MLSRFITNYPFGVLKDKQKVALEFLIKKLETSIIQSLKQQSYVLATIKHETADTFEPIKERGSLKYLKGKSYYPFIGRGYVQITWKNNYETFGKLLGIDLVGNMDLALNPEYAWKICEIGMSRGLFTGKKLNDYFNDEISDWYNARRIINRLDRAIEISELAQKIYQTLEDK
jgi:predicted chitinase